MKLWVMGAGSIGSRRTNILLEMGHEVHVSDPDPDRLADIHPNARPCDLDGVECDAVFVCTPPGMSRPEDIIAASLPDPDGLFVEKPLCTDPGALVQIPSIAREIPTTMGACNMRFAYPAKSEADVGAITRFVMKQAAHYWSPGHQRVNLLLDSIHELDLAVHYNGPIQGATGTSGVDRALVVLTHTNGLTSIIDMDRTSTPRVRKIEFITRDFTRTKFPNTGDLMYRLEMEHFLFWVERGCATMNPLSSAAYVNHLALSLI